MMTENYIEVESKSFGELLSGTDRFVADYGDFKAFQSSRSYEDLVNTSKNLKFRDGDRQIDMVLCYEDSDDENDCWDKRNKRRVFHEQLRQEGLDLEIEHKNESLDQKTFFVKIHLPSEIEHRYAQAFKIKPLIEGFTTQKDSPQVGFGKVRSFWNDLMNFLLKAWNAFKSLFDPNIIGKDPSYYSEIEGRSAKEVFVEKIQGKSYTLAQKSLLVNQILLRTRFDDSDEIGIQRLVNDGVYKGYYPLHEDIKEDGEHNDRSLLLSEWARFGKWFKRQPLWLVKKYFGEKVALYFCWLGFYTNMLVWPAIVGVLCFLYGILTMDSSDNIPSKEICDESGIGNTTLCPLCNKACSYLKLSNSCSNSQFSYLFDNPATVFFSIFMSFWAITFLELWKRKQAVTIWEWDLENVEKDEVPRPEFESSVKTYRMNPVTKKTEPYITFWQKSVRIFISSSGVLTMVAFVLAAFLGVIFYRISVLSVIYSRSGDNFRKHAKMLTSISASFMNLAIIMTLIRVYRKLAIWLTNFENPRTQTEFEDSYAFKIFILQFNNFYGSLIYIAFFKGKFFTKPGDGGFLNLRMDVCDPSGCLIELCMQLSIIMIGKQAINNIREYFIPILLNWWRKRTVKKISEEEKIGLTSWERDYNLEDLGRLPLFEEYKEMIIQYGFVTLFVAAFPLAPLFALLNNIMEIRVDARKMVSHARRPIAERVEDIGAWYGILQVITHIAVVSNAFVIAFTSDFIPKIVYKLYYSPNNDLHGYVQHSLLAFNTSQYQEYWGQETDHQKDPSVCYFRGYQVPTDTEEPFGYNVDFWHVMFARVAFVVVFEHIVFILTKTMQYIIPDVPKELKIQIQHEQLAVKEVKLGYARSARTPYSRENFVETLSSL